jgi:hypothetical protein
LVTRLPRLDDPLAALDALVFAAGPAAICDRPALLGQPLGAPSFERFQDSVVCRLTGEPAAALADAATSLAASRRGRSVRCVLRRFAVCVRQPMPVPPGLCLIALISLAFDRLAVAGSTRGADHVAARVAAEELTVAALEVASFGEITARRR